MHVGTNKRGSWLVKLLKLKGFIPDFVEESRKEKRFYGRNKYISLRKTNGFLGEQMVSGS